MNQKNTEKRISNRLRSFAPPSLPPASSFSGAPPTWARRRFSSTRKNTNSAETTMIAATAAKTYR